MAKPLKSPEPTPELDYTGLLRVWRVMAAALDELPESDLWKLLEYEKANSKRILFMQRIYGRASTLRGKREAKELRAIADGE